MSTNSMPRAGEAETSDSGGSPANAYRLNEVWIVSLIALALTLVWLVSVLGARSLWMDELFTAILAAPDTPRPLSDSLISTDYHPPLYFYGTRYWMALLGGTSEWTLRAFNLVAFALALGAGAWAVREKVDAPVALWMPLFFTAFGVLWYMQEARMYAFMMCHAFVTCVLALIYEKRQSAPLTATYSAVAVLNFVALPFVHWFAALFSGLVLFFLFLAALRERRFPFAVLFLVSGLAMGTIALAWIVTHFEKTLGSFGEYDVGAALAPWYLRQSAIGLLVFAFCLNPLLIYGAVRAGLSTLGSPLKRPVMTALALGAVLTPVIILAVSLHTPMNQLRNFTSVLAPATLFAAVGVAKLFDEFRLSSSQVAAALAAILAFNGLVSWFGLDRIPMLTRDQWREAAEFIKAQPGCAAAPIAVTAFWAKRPPPDDVSVDYPDRMYGYYLGPKERIVSVFKDDAALPKAAFSKDCAVALWMAHTTPESAEARVKELFGEAQAGFRRVHYRGNVVFLRPSA